MNNNLKNNIPLIANNNLTEEEKELILKNTSISFVKKNEYVIQLNDRPLGLICLLAGKVKIFQEGYSNREQILRLSKPGGYIGYRALFAGQNYTASAIAIEDSIIGTIKKETLFEVLQKNPKATFELLKDLANELGVSNLRTISLTQKHLRGRLAEALIFIANTYGYKEDSITINATLTRDDIAALSNMTTSNAIRILSQFAEEKIIALDKRDVKILDTKKLNHINNIG